MLHSDCGYVQKSWHGVTAEQSNWRTSIKSSLVLGGGRALILQGCRDFPPIMPHKNPKANLISTNNWIHKRINDVWQWLRVMGLSLEWLFEPHHWCGYTSKEILISSTKWHNMTGQMEYFTNPWDLFCMSIWERAHIKHLERERTFRKTKCSVCHIQSGPVRSSHTS